MLQLQVGRSIKWRAIFVESAFIGASILLAFALQDWDEAKDIEERTQIAMCNVKSELSFNQVLIERGYLPKQKGLLASINAVVAVTQRGEAANLSLANLEQMLVQESLRYSAWSLAAESGYMLHANFELATEIGAVIDFQKDSYQPVINRLNEALFDSGQTFNDEPTSSQVKLLSLTNEWISKTRYLQSKYEQLFGREDFISLACL